MRRLVLSLGLAAVLGGCGLKEETFRQEYAALGCEALIECESTGTTLFLFDSVEDCELFLNAFFAGAVAGCDYDGGAARSCLESMENVGCDDMEGVPQGCAEVYGGEECTWGDP